MVEQRRAQPLDYTDPQRRRWGSAVPKVESVLINQTDVAAMGAGETAVTVAAAAIGNAVFDATGVRLREIPFTPERVKTALKQRQS